MVVRCSIGEPVHDHERLYATLAATARPAQYGLSAEAFGAIQAKRPDFRKQSLFTTRCRDYPRTL